MSRIFVTNMFIATAVIGLVRGAEYAASMLGFAF